MISYFAADGSYGDAENITIVDTSKWTENDWNLIEQSSDDERHLVAQSISTRRIKWLQ